MRLKPKPLMAFICLFVLAGCATATPTDDTALPFAEPAAADVLTAGLDSISDKYIEDVELSRVGIEGLRGLGAIDAGVTLLGEHGQLTLIENGEKIAEMRYPPAADARAWAAAMVALTERARQHSSDLRAASSEKIYEAIFDGALSDLDIFSRYAGSDQASRNRAKRDGFGGIGIRYRIYDDRVIVNKVLKGSPAFDAGVQINDEITAINGTALVGLRSREITKMIRGPLRTELRLTVARATATEPFDISLARAHIVPETVFVSIEDNIAIIRIRSFNQDTANALEQTLRELRSQQQSTVLGLVLDLRSNPGGLLRQSIRVADLMLTQGDILRTVGRHPDSLNHYAAAGDDIAGGLPIVVLIDGKSASAAEIVAAALQDRDRAVVVGTASYGKGSVQTVIRLPNDGEITLTWSRFVAPSGYQLHGLGVVPTVCTSGRRKLDEASTLIEDALSAKSVSANETWQRRSLLSTDQRKTLRSGCPAETRRGPLDVEVAKRLIMDRKLHARALSITTTTAQALN